MGSLLKDKISRAFVLKCVGAAYFATAIGLSQFRAVDSSQGQIYPFYDWHLFSSSPARYRHYLAVISQSDDPSIVTPCEINECTGLIPEKRRIAVRLFIRRMGQSQEAGDSDKYTFFRRQLEREFLGKTKLNYTISAVDVDPIAYVLKPRP